MKRAGSTDDPTKQHFIFFDGIRNEHHHVFTLLRSPLGANNPNNRLVLASSLNSLGTPLSTGMEVDLQLCTFFFSSWTHEEYMKAGNFQKIHDSESTENLEKMAPREVPLCRWIRKADG